MKIVIIGAGIGGLSAGIALKKHGHEVSIYEKVKTILPVGAALSLWSNGVKCLNYLGLGEQTKALGGNMAQMAYIDGKSNQDMTRFSLKPVTDSVGQCPYPVSRAELQNMLMDEFGRKHIHLGAACTGLEEKEDGIYALFDEHEPVVADLVIGADGTHSGCRNHVLKGSALGNTLERRYAGYVNWNGLVEMDEAIAPADGWTIFVGDGKRASVMPIADARFYFFFDVPLPLGLGNNKNEYKTKLKTHFDGWCAPVQKLIDKIDPQTTNRIEIHDITPFDTWVKGRCVLLGDAAHSTTPDIGQGACQALEDAIYLARSLSINNNILSDALLRYQKVRSQRANDLVLRARKRCDVVHAKDHQVTQNWYEQLRTEDGERIINGIISNIQGNPLD